MNAFERLKKFFGGTTGLAAHYGVTAETVRLWGVNGLPPSKALDFEADTGGEVTAREVLEHKRDRQKAAA